MAGFGEWSNMTPEKFNTTAATSYDAVTNCWSAEAKEARRQKKQADNLANED